MNGSEPDCKASVSPRIATRKKSGPRANHDLVAIGSSAGGYSALREIIGTLPGDLPAAVVVVMHVGSGRSILPEILASFSKLRVVAASHGTKIQRGHVYVAPPDRHLLVRDSRLVLTHGPFENGTRPAVDPLFRSAAVSHGARAVGVVLSGADSDGASGLRAIKRCGGIAVAQDPREAPFPEMPQAAIADIAVDHVVTARAMPALIARLVSAPPGRARSVPRHLRQEVEIAERLGHRNPWLDESTDAGAFTCPDCGGRLSPASNDLHFRCEVGHAYSASGLLQKQSTEIENALWVALRTHKERAGLLRRMAATATKERQYAAAKTWRTRAAEYEGYAGAIHKALATSQRGPMDRPEGRDPGYKSPKRKYTGISRGKARGSTPGGKRNG